MNVDRQSGLLQDVTYCASPNCDDRPVDGEIEVLIIHAISLPPGLFGGDDISDFFCNRLNFSSHCFYQEIKNLEVSAHFLIDRAGKLTQYVPLHKRAWHAGESECLGRNQVNDFSIGIELEGDDDTEFTEKQYTALIALTVELIDRYPKLAVDKIYGHSDIAHGRKTDPGPKFDWIRYRKSCRDILRLKN